MISQCFRAPRHQGAFLQPRPLVGTLIPMARFKSSLHRQSPLPVMQAPPSQYLSQLHAPQHGGQHAARANWQCPRCRITNSTERRECNQCGLCAAQGTPAIPAKIVGGKVRTRLIVRMCMTHAPGSTAGCKHASRMDQEAELLHAGAAVEKAPHETQQLGQ